MHQLTSLAFLPLFLLATFLHADGQAPLIMPVDDPEAVETHRVIWPTEPGIRYELMESTDLETWSVVAGFPTEAEALAQQHAFELAGGAEPRFFKVRALDEQAPDLVTATPAQGDFGVPRFSTIAIELSDATGVDPASITLEISGQGSFTVSEPDLSFTEGVLLFDNGGDTALGGYGDTITVSLTVADILGHATTYQWAFDLEQEAKVLGNNLLRRNVRASELVLFPLQSWPGAPRAAISTECAEAAMHGPSIALSPIASLFAMKAIMSRRLKQVLLYQT